jgi:hypothetical protein
MPEIIRSRDVIVFFKGDTYTVAIDNAMAIGGWAGGQGVMWVDSGSNDTPTVTYSNGLYGGFLVWGSDEAGDDFVSMTRSQPAFRYATIFLGGSLISTSTYERYTYASRVGGGPLVPIVYKANDFLYFSLRGFWTSEDEPSIVHAPQEPAFFAGMCAQVPKASNKYFLGVQTSL